MVSSCFRCFGGLILFDLKQGMEDTNFAQRGLMTWHLLPSLDRRLLAVDKEDVILKIEKYLPYYEARTMYRCGGNLDSEENRELYHVMKEELENPIKNLFPNIPIPGVEPNGKTFFSNILFNDQGQVSANSYSGKEKYRKLIK